MASDVINLIRGYYEITGTKGDYKKHLHPAKLLLGRCDGDIDYAFETLRRCRDWARSKNVEFSLYTCLTHFHEFKQKEERQYTRTSTTTHIKDLLKGYGKI